MITVQQSEVASIHKWPFSPQGEVNLHSPTQEPHRSRFPELVETVSNLSGKGSEGEGQGRNIWVEKREEGEIWLEASPRQATGNALAIGVQEKRIC